LEARGRRGFFTKTPLEIGWAEVGCGLGCLGRAREKGRGKEMGCAQGEEERGFSLYFFPFSFSDFCFSFQNQFQICFESNFDNSKLP
jgi:hypothetical protein